MIVVPLGSMLLEQFTHRLRAEVLINPGTWVKQRVGHSVAHGLAKPIIYHVAGEPPLRTLHYRFRQKRPANLPVQPFSRSIPDLEVRRQSFHIFDDFFVDKWNAKF